MWNKNKSRNYSLRLPKDKLVTNKNPKNDIKTFKSVNYNENKIKIKPPFNPGLFSYNLSIRQINKKKQNYSRNIKKNNSNFFSSNNYSLSPNITKKASNEKHNNYLNNIFNLSRNKKITNKNTLLSQSNINLNKYKINNSVQSSIRNVDNSTGNKNINNFINKSINLNININYQKSNNKNENNINYHYKNYFAFSSKYEIESRRMLIEYIKIMNKKEKNIKNVLQRNNISHKILNQKNQYLKQVNYNEINPININSNEILLGESKKKAFLNNLDYSSSHSNNSSDKEVYFEPSSNVKNINHFSPPVNKNKFLNNSMDKFRINFPNSQNNKKIKIINFLLVPKILNIIESDEKSKKYIFILVPDESTYINGIENYKLIWKDIENFEIKSEISINDIKECYINDKYSNRFILNTKGNEFNIEIEAPTKQISEYIVNGINYISKNRKINQ